MTQPTLMLKNHAPITGLGLESVAMRFVAVGIFVSFACCSPANALTWNDAKYCNAKGCYNPDPLGGWGLSPRRTYRLIYNGDPVCPVIQKALNDTVDRDDSKDTLPQKFDGQIGWHELENESKGIRRPQNPIFSSPTFLQWNFIRNRAGGSDSSDLDPYGHPGNRAFQRWQIVPLKNDGRPYLITEWSASSPTSIEITAPNYPKVWNIPKDQLKGKDWSDYKSYENFKTFPGYEFEL